MKDDLRAKTYDPMDAVRADVRELMRRMLAAEDRIIRLSYWRAERTRYTQLRGFRKRAIVRLAELGKLSLAELGEAFGLSRQRVEQIVKRGLPSGKKRRGRPRKE